VTAQLPEALAAYLVARDRDREQHTDAALAALTLRERYLIREAAVMGYVQGAMSPRGEAIPPDSEVLRLVVSACLAMPDLYPHLSQGDPR
jgi:hypothetical protein